jgi:hypothetical protein
MVPGMLSGSNAVTVRKSVRHVLPVGTCGGRAGGLVDWVGEVDCIREAAHTRKGVSVGTRDVPAGLRHILVNQARSCVDVERP